MVIFYETKNFTVESYDKPHICRTDGGHIVIRPKELVVNRWDLDTKKAKEMAVLSMVVGEAMFKAMNNRGIPVERMNFQDNGNWGIGSKKGPKMHLHIYGRAKNSVHQKHGEAIYLPKKNTKFYEKLDPLNKEDIEEILKEIKIILQREKYHELR